MKYLLYAGFLVGAFTSPCMSSNPASEIHLDEQQPQEAQPLDQETLHQNIVNSIYQNDLQGVQDALASGADLLRGYEEKSYIEVAAQRGCNEIVADLVVLYIAYFNRQKEQLSPHALSEINTIYRDLSTLYNNYPLLKKVYPIIEPFLAYVQKRAVYRCVIMINPYNQLLSVVYKNGKVFKINGKHWYGDAYFDFSLSKWRSVEETIRYH